MVDLVPPPASTPFDSVPHQPAATQATVPRYTLQANLKQVANLASYPTLTAEERRRLGAVGFVASPTTEPQLDGIYRDALADRRPLFITADVPLYAFHRVLADTRRRLESESLPAALTALTLTLLERSMEQYQVLASVDLKEAARRNLAYLGVAGSLLGIPLELEAGAAALVQQETQRLAGTAGPDAIFPYAVLVEPASPSSGDERLDRCRRALAWYRGAPLATDYTSAAGQPTPAWGVVRQLLLLSHALAAPPDAPLGRWHNLADTLRFLDGGGGELDLTAVLVAATEVYGPRRSLRAYEDFAKLQAFAARLADALPPALTPPGREPGRPGPVGCRLLDRPRRPDDAIFAELTLPTRREVASGVELFAALGSPRAADLVQHAFRLPALAPRYATIAADLQQRLDAFAPTVWKRDLAWARLWAAVPLDPPTTKGRPAFQQSAAWRDRALLTTLANWAASRCRPPLAPPGAPAPQVLPEPLAQPPVAYVEPVPEVYSRLRWLSARTVTGLEAHGLLTDPMRATHRGLQDLCTLLQTVAERELRNDSPTLAERQQLAAVGHRLHDLTTGLDPTLPPAEQALPDFATLPTDEGRRRAAVGLGPALRMLVVVPDAGRFYLATGALLSYLEARLPATPTLDRATWLELMGGEQPPGLPAWCATAVAASESGPQPTAQPLGLEKDQP